MGLLFYGVSYLRLMTNGIPNGNQNIACHGWEYFDTCGWTILHDTFLVNHEAKLV
ncbi:MAG: hypothetical protein U0T81_05700 [Saprospiraceae bacterium]